MRSPITHILFTIVLSFAVTDYLWIELFEDEQIVAEWEVSGEQEELRENESKSEDHFLDYDWSFDSPLPCSFQNSFPAGFVKHGNSFLPLTRLGNPKLYLLHQQLLIDC